MKKLLVFLVMFGVLMMGIGSVIAATPTFTDIGFKYSSNGGSTWIPMSGNLSNGFVLPTDGSSSTTYLISYNGTTATDLGNGPFGLYLKSTTVQISTLDTYYTGKGQPYENYLKDALLIGNSTNQKPFAYIVGPTGSLKLQDAAQWDLNGYTNVSMVIPGNYPKGTYTVEGIVNGSESGTAPVTYKLIIGNNNQEAGENLVGNATVTVVQGTVDVTISPLLITFGNLRPGTVNASATSGNVVISANTTDASYANISIEVDVTESTLFENNLFFGNVLADDYAVELLCVGSGFCTYTPVTFLPKLTVPFGTQLGFEDAVITYTITGAEPA